VDEVRKHLDGLDPAAQTRILGRNAVDAYRLAL